MTATEIRDSIILSPVLDLRAAGPLAAAMLAWRGDDLSLDASRVERVGGQCLQVILAARNQWAAEGRSFRVLGASDAFKEAADLMGAAPLLPTGA
ncbi:STAS domain-containing protein [Muricoccus radiodurans]|uniref:STAS domain-containing protein n=1 Tax=Muricoccus radiodurans TaxID=2231721 RepID=UPI003CE9F6AC